MSLTAFSERTGASVSTVLRWCKRGLPVQRIPRPGGGRPALFFGPDAVQWTAAHGNLTQRRKALALVNKSVPQATAAPASPASAPSAPGTDADEEGLIAACERLRKQELATHKLLMSTKAAGDLHGATVLSERYTAECRALAHLEGAAVAHRVRIGELVLKSDIEGAYKRVLTGLKNNLMGIPSGVVPRLMAYLRDPNDAHAVRSILDEAIRGALRATAERHNLPEA